MALLYSQAMNHYQYIQSDWLVRMVTVTLADGVAELKYGIITRGVLSVMMDGVSRMLMWYADNLTLLELFLH